MKKYVFIISFFILLGCVGKQNLDGLYKINSGKGWETDVKPSQLQNYIEWKDAINLLASNKVESVMQGHNLVVRIFLKNGEMFSTIEPDIDTIFLVIEQCGAPCENIMLITE